VVVGMTADWTVRPATTAPPRDLEPPCRCGWPDDAPLGNPPVRVPIVDLTDAPGAVVLSTTPVRAACRSCTHPIQPGQAAVLHHLRPGTSAVFNRYHPECVDLT
jgi:hypothetical protein